MVKGRFFFIRKLIILRQILLRIMRLNRKRFNKFRKRLPDKNRQAFIPKKYRYLLNQESDLNPKSITKIVNEMNLP